VAFDDTTSMRDVARHLLHFGASESCGKCFPCRIGLRRAHEMFANGTVDRGKLEELLETLEVLPGVDRVTRITRPYKLASRDFKPSDTIVEAGGQYIGGREFVVMAGPCSVETRDQLLRTAESVAASGASARIRLDLPVEISPNSAT